MWGARAINWARKYLNPSWRPPETALSHSCNHSHSLFFFLLRIYLIHSSLFIDFLPNYFAKLEEKETPSLLSSCKLFYINEDEILRKMFILVHIKWKKNNLQKTKNKLITFIRSLIIFFLNLKFKKLFLKFSRDSTFHQFNVIKYL